MNKLNHAEEAYWNTEISDSLLDSIAASGLEWGKYWPDEVELLLAIGQGKMHLFLDSCGQKMAPDHETVGLGAK